MFLGEYLADRPLKDDTSLLEKNETVAVQGGQVEIVDHADNGHAFVIQPLEEIVDFGLGTHIESRGSLVQKQKRGLLGQSPGDEHPLQFAAGKLVRLVVDAFAEPVHILHVKERS